jgi:hypothetical protein
MVSTVVASVVGNATAESRGELDFSNPAYINVIQVTIMPAQSPRSDVMRRYYHTHVTERGPTNVTDAGAVAGLMFTTVAVVGLLAAMAPVATGWALVGAVVALAARRTLVAVGRRPGWTPITTQSATPDP